ncbi:HAD family hydrolase [Phreatobacter stygius]|uniref:HAD family hydrolase n=1 Tax=Phreatobacter stygius TaxID=1940610 RepID=A0A4D7B8J7_9HYPH|nr:HAD-IA family hydrolase [Phreatobacter stygius]QCI64422.1 HAD family hydrolase [Phreatobacter stygius]
MSDPVRALIFDMDGTIVDNMRFHDDAWEIFHRRHGLPFDRDQHFVQTAGRSLPEIFAGLFPGLTEERRAALAEEKEELYRAAYKPHAQPLAGLTALLDAADALHLPSAVATAAPPDNIAVVLDTLDLRRRFKAIASPAMGLRGKPNPDIFLKSAELLGVPPESCLVFEDAPLGVEAARRAGMRAVAVTTMLAPEAFAEFPNRIATITDFTGFDLQGLTVPA